MDYVVKCIVPFCLMGGTQLIGDVFDNLQIESANTTSNGLYNPAFFNTRFFISVYSLLKSHDLLHYLNLHCSQIFSTSIPTFF